MKHDVLERYLDLMPEEAVDSMLELANEQRWAVLLALIAKKRMYFNEIKDEFGAAPAQVDTALKHLVAGGFVARQVGDIGDIGDRGKTFYTPTPMGRAVTKALADAFLPPAPAVVVPQSATYTVMAQQTVARTYSGTSLPMAIGIDVGPEKAACDTSRQHKSARGGRVTIHAS